MKRLRIIAATYLVVLVGAPLYLVFHETFKSGWSAFWSALHEPQMLASIKLTLLIAVVVTPLNALFGIGASLAIVRHPSRWTKALDRLIDVPLALSPIFVGVMLELAYSAAGWFGSPLAAHGLRIMFSWPGIAMASAAVSLPLVSREIIPLLRELGETQEQTAATLGASARRTFFTVTLPAMKWAVAYGLLLTLARVIGEYGAVLVVSGNVAYQTQTLTLDIAENFENYNPAQGFTGAAMLATVSILALIILGIIKRRERASHEH